MMNDLTYGQLIVLSIIKKARIIERLDKLGLEHNAESIQQLIKVYVETPNTLKNIGSNRHEYEQNA